MSDTEELLLNPQKQLLFAVSNTRNILGSLSEEIETLIALVNDFGEKMNSDIRERWKAKLAVSLQDCELNKSSIPDEMQRLSMAALRAIEGRFYEVVEKNYKSAGSCYEQSANALASIPELERLITYIAQPVFPVKGEDNLASDGQKIEFKERELDTITVALAFPYRLPEAGLWSSAGDAYCQVGDMASARRCYDMGLKVSNEVLAGEVGESWALALRHINSRLSLSMSAAVLIPSDEWQQAELLYRKAADSMFFNIEKRDNNTYRDICGVLVYGSGIGPYWFAEPNWFPRVPISIGAQKEDRLLRLKAELGQRALDALRAEFEKSEEGFPVPETYFLVAILSGIYMKLQNYDSCVNLLNLGSNNFDDAFYEWSFDELTEAHDWAFSFIEHGENVSFARGLLQRPDYKEFIDRMKKAEESHQRLEWRQIRFEKFLEGVGDKTSLEEVRRQLTAENPWLEEAANPGSILNAELIFQQLKKTNWGEVVMGYCNAVEEELKEFIYKKYLAYVAGQSDKNYAQESQRQNNPGSVLYFIASIATTRMKDRLWDSFVKATMPEHHDFLYDQLPSSVALLIELRNPSAHGRMPEPVKAERAREIVLGKQQPGLLEKLVMLRKPST